MCIARAFAPEPASSRRARVASAAKSARRRRAVVDPSGTRVTLEDGTQLTIPGNLDLRGKALKPGADVSVTYADRGR